MNRLEHTPVPYQHSGDVIKVLWDIVNTTLAKYGVSASLSSQHTLGEGAGLSGSTSAAVKDCFASSPAPVLPLTTSCPDCQGYGEVPQSSSSCDLVRCETCRGKGWVL